MERRAYQLLHDAETSWWYEGRMHVISRVLKKFLNTGEPMKILDVGAGYGGMLETLKVYGEVTAEEQDDEARAILSVRGYDHILSPERERSEPGAFDMITAFDVLEHTPDDIAFLQELRDALRGDGHLILTVPAFNFLWSSHDTDHHHYRRYTAPELRQKLSELGFSMRYVSYWNTLLFLPAALIRLAGGTGKSTLSMPRFLDRIFFAIITVESLLIPTCALPFGTGIIVVAQKNHAKT